MYSNGTAVVPVGDRMFISHHPVTKSAVAVEHRACNTISPVRDRMSIASMVIPRGSMLVTDKARGIAPSERCVAVCRCISSTCGIRCLKQVANSIGTLQRKLRMLAYARVYKFGFLSPTGLDRVSTNNYFQMKNLCC